MKQTVPPVIVRGLHRRLFLIVPPPCCIRRTSSKGLRNEADSIAGLRQGAAPPPVPDRAAAVLYQENNQ